MYKADSVQQYIMNILKFTVMGEGELSELLDERGVICIHDKEDPQGFKIFEEVLGTLEQQKILPLTYDFWKASSYRFEALDIKTTECCMDFYRILACSAGITRIFESNNIPSVVLKGFSIAKFYPVPEYRKSADADILLADPGDAQRACELLEENGFVREDDSHSLHHIELMSPGNVLVELHTEMAEPFDNANANKLLNDLAIKGCEKRVRVGHAGEEVFIYENATLGLSIVIHALQHFMRKGMGVKMLSDWAVFIQNSGIDNAEAEQLKHYLSDLKIKGFADALTRLAVFYLGTNLSKASLLCDDCASPLKDWEKAFLTDMFVGGEFGKSHGDRMVNLRGTHITDYIREFHHQMMLNFPKAGKVIVIWPVLWTVTLVRFLVNNRKLRGTKTGDILKSAGERGRIVSGMKLFGG